MEEKEYKYMVAVQCMTFNQSKYILDALNGFVMQQTNFPYVVMVVDDASTDGEQEVIRKFVSEQFDTNDASVAYEKETDYAHITYAQHKTNKNCYIAILYLKENHYSQRKPKMPYLAEWRDYVKYEALCEGDDYWIHPQKLQMQVDFLEENREYSMCSHRIYRLDYEKNIFYRDVLESIFKNKRGIEVCNRTKIWLTETSSVLCRMQNLIEYNNYKGIRRDIVKIYFLLKNGKGFCLSEIMSVYRQNEGGIFAKQPIGQKLIQGSYGAMKDLYYNERTSATRYLYYKYYANVFLATHARIIFMEKFDFLKIFSLIYFIPLLVFMKHPLYRPM